MVQKSRRVERPGSKPIKMIKPKASMVQEQSSVTSRKEEPASIDGNYSMRELAALLGIDSEEETSRETVA